MAVVKSNAYGHGLVDFSREMERLGADFIGVDSMTEARALRREGVTLPILVLGYTMPELFAEAARDNISLTVSTFETLDALRKVCRSQTSTGKSDFYKLPPFKIHIKVDTGMHRQGFMLHDLKKVMKNFQFPRLPIGGQAISNFQMEGLYTHFASAKNPAFPKDTRDQIAEFRKWIAAFRKAGHHPIVHAAATGAALLYPESHFDMVRIGIGLYGLWPAVEVREYLKDRVILKPALLWKSFITEVKRLPQGSRVGYDLTEELRQSSTVAVVPVGYWHGFPRALSSIGRVTVRGAECRVLGRVSMDMLSIDVSGVQKPKVGDEVIVMGGADSKPVSAASLARSLDASWYEVITRLNPLIKRIYR